MITGLHSGHSSTAGTLYVDTHDLQLGRLKTSRPYACLLPPCTTATSTPSAYRDPVKKFMKSPKKDRAETPPPRPPSVSRLLPQPLQARETAEPRTFLVIGILILAGHETTDPVLLASKFPRNRSEAVSHTAKGHPLPPSCHARPAINFREQGKLPKHGRFR